MTGFKWAKDNKLGLINLIGSVSSIVGFAILILSLLSENSRRPPQVIVWQYVFFIISVLFISSSIVFTYVWVAEGLTEERLSSRLVVRLSCKLFVGVILAGVGFDGLISSIHWTWWLIGLYDAFAQP